ncbi:radical SAM protein [Candidatus Bathyarchaeota archaeon]|nr:radical SAM protein [Candidatus Bathyarchaeota archaeon]
MGSLEKNRTLTETDLPRQIRVSTGSAIVLGLMEGKLNAEPTTIYLMTYKVGKCTANCGFCPQARNSHSSAELLSRVSWPTFPISSVLKKIGQKAELGKIMRVCIQALNYPDVFTHLTALIAAIKQHTSIPISVSCQPLIKENIRRLAEAGAERIGIPIDAATEKLFSEVKGENAQGPYSWKQQFRQLCEAVEVFGRGRVSTHLIIGLGETEKESVSLIQKCVDIDVFPALFAFTPVRGTTLEMKPQPLVESYRRIQLARHLIINRQMRSECMRFDSSGHLTDYGIKKEKLALIVENGTPFLTSGCPNCNRPFYNEKPSGPIYNYPTQISKKEIAEIKQQLGLKHNV